MPNYTYDDFVKAADSAGLTGSFDESDLTMAQRFPEYGLSMVSLKRDLGNAQTAEQRLLATEAMNQLRKNYGSYGVGEPGSKSYAASYGSQIDKALGDIGSYGDFQFSRDNDYKNMLDRVITQQSFSYDPLKDPIFSSYKKAYNREGDRAAANALAAAAAATGGRASSYANMAAQQAGNYYAGKLADMIPQLRSMALTEYNNQYEQLLQQLNALSGQRNTEYQQYLDRLSQMQQNLQNLQTQDKTDYERYLDAVNEEYQRERAAAADRQNEFDNALKVFEATGQITGALADYLGGGSTYADAAAVYTGGGSYGGGSYGGSKSKNTTAAQEEINAILSKWGTSLIDGEPYVDSNGNPFVLIGSWDEYQRLKELGNWSDEALNAAGIRYNYPTTTDENGNTIPATAYVNIYTGEPVSWEQHDTAGGNYKALSQAFETMKQGGASKDEVLKEIRDSYNAGDLTYNDYQTLYRKYRQTPSSEFGTAKDTTGTGTAKNTTGTGTVKPGTRTPSTAWESPAATTPAAPAQTTPAAPPQMPDLSLQNWLNTVNNALTGGSQAQAGTGYVTPVIALPQNTTGGSTTTPKTGSQRKGSGTFGGGAR